MISVRFLILGVVVGLKLIVLFSCNSAVNEMTGLVAEQPELVESIEYFEFRPDTSSFGETREIVVDEVYQLDSLTIIAGYNQFDDNGGFANGDNENDWGYRLYVLNNSKEIRYKSQGVGDYYLFEPHFYRNNVNSKTFIICQLGFEYLAGGEVFLIDEGKVKYIGFLDVSGDDMETGVVDIVNIQEVKEGFTFTFKSDSVLMNPATGSPEFVGKSNVRYTYKNDTFHAIEE